MKGQVAIITGGSRGLGAAIADAFSREGAIVITCNRQTADVRSEITVRQFVAKVAKEYGRIDILVNNAAVLGPVGPLESNDLRQWRTAIDTNLLGPVYFAAACLETMKAQNSGRIINIAGGGACDPLPRRTAYACSKAALVRFTESLAAELTGTGITVNAVLPGPMDTDMHREILAAGPDSVGHKAHQDQAAAVMSDPANVAQLCAYLATADGITGRTISARWDSWPWDAAAIVKLMSADLFTLRRVNANA